MRREVATGLGLAALGVAGCGGGERQDANEKAGTYNVEVVEARFASRQHVSRQERMQITVRNADTRTIPNLAVTVESFASREDRQDLSDATRPTWIVDNGPEGGVTAYTNTWSGGALRPGRTRSFTWRVTPVKAGRHRVAWRVAAGLNGKAKAQLAGGETPGGTFAVNVSKKPSQSRVDPETGRVIRSGEAG